MKISATKASDISNLLNGSLSGNGERDIDSISKIDQARPNSLCFLGNPKYEKFLYSNRDLTVLVENGFSPKSETENTLIYVDDVYGKFSKVLKEYKNQLRKKLEIDDQASIEKSVTIGENVGVGCFSVIKGDTIIGSDTEIMQQVFIGANVRIGSNAKIYPGVRILDDCIIGDHVTIHSNAVIGSDGFGFSASDVEYDKIPQIGNVIIEDWVDIGSNTVIDRATMGATIIKKGVKLDNLIQVGHNVIIGEHTVIAAQSGIAGSSEIGERSRLGGQVGVSGHIKIAPYSQIQAKSGIASSIEEPGKKWYGYPIIPYTKYLRSYAVFKKLPEIMKRLVSLEEKVEDK